MRTVRVAATGLLGGHHGLVRGHVDRRDRHHILGLIVGKGEQNLLTGLEPDASGGQVGEGVPRVTRGPAGEVAAVEDMNAFDADCRAPPGRTDQLHAAVEVVVAEVFMAAIVRQFVTACTNRN
jgi:hypothetical protein